ncbi:hypothetical protein SAMN05661010_02280 [Modicisalibacter muralis]|uniref:Lipoprotein n=1 Tax=Modicisalibacter muralis TaxID=119000 RepID=A0A1G9M3B4_9GAMM|nr:hypothetical protein [Halomonas muralis]SDL68760.1 hypothetical protein SAMN05661010_02280 [Halomonas muralis]
MTHSLTSVFLLSLMVLFATGCSYTPARIHPEPIIEIDDHDHRHGHGEFCPPGQAKKGRC